MEQVEIVASPAPAARSPSAGAHGGASSSRSRAGGADAPGSAGGAATRSSALHTAKAAAAPDVAGCKRKALYASGMFSPPGKAARTRDIRPALNFEEIRKFVNVQYTWQWRTLDGTYEDFNKEQCIELEINWRKRLSLARVWGTRFPVGLNEMLKCIIDLDDMTTSIVGCDWATAVRRWDRDVPMGDSWDHQDDDVRIVDVQTASRDYTVVASAFFDRQRPDGKTPLISCGTQTVLKVRRVQNRALLSRFEGEKKIMHRKRGKDTVELTCEYAWHCSGKTQPDNIAAGSGLMTQFGSEQGFYGQGNYSAHQASYSHHERYVYRSSDAKGDHHDASGPYFHLLLVNVLRGNPLKTTEVWKGACFGAVHQKLGQQFDSVEGGPHQPFVSGPHAARARDSDDSMIYVAYLPSQCLPEFIVTYTANAS